MKLKETHKKRVFQYVGFLIVIFAIANYEIDIVIVSWFIDYLWD